MENKISINSKIILNYVMFKLDKIENSFTEEELNKINEIIINFDDEIENNLLFEELKLFNNLTSLYILNGYIYNDDFNILLSFKRLNNIYFEKCEFENADSISSLQVECLSLINCKINDYSFFIVLNQLKELSIINGDVSIEKLNKLNNLNYLQLSYCNISSENKEIVLPNLKYLDICNCNITDLTFVYNLRNLKELIIDKTQYKINRNLISELKQKNLIIYDENRIKFDGDENEI